MRHSLVFLLVATLIMGGIALAENITWGPYGSSAQTAGWQIQQFYAEIDTGFCDSASWFETGRAIDTIYTDWLYVGARWDAFWYQWLWVKADTSLAADSTDTVFSVMIQGCLDKVNYPTPHNYQEVTTNKDAPCTVSWFQPIDSLAVDPPYPYLRTRIIYGTWEDSVYCVEEWKDTLYERESEAIFEERIRPIDIY